MTTVAEYLNGELLLKGDKRPAWIQELQDQLLKGQTTI